LSENIDLTHPFLDPLASRRYLKYGLLKWMNKELKEKTRYKNLLLAIFKIISKSNLVKWDIFKDKNRELQWNIKVKLIPNILIDRIKLKLRWSAKIKFQGKLMPWQSILKIKKRKEIIFNLQI
jgi:hypothetical protein